MQYAQTTKIRLTHVTRPALRCLHRRGAEPHRCSAGRRQGHARPRHFARAPRSECVTHRLRQPLSDLSRGRLLQERAIEGCGAPCKALVGRSGVMGMESGNAHDSRTLAHSRDLRLSWFATHLVRRKEAIHRRRRKFQVRSQLPRCVRPDCALRPRLRRHRGPVYVVGVDKHRFDADGDGVGCES